MNRGKTKQVEPDGIVLKFDVATVRRLADHARTSKGWLPYYGGAPTEPALWLVGDGGVYLMSNGTPPMDVNGNLLTQENTKGVQRLTAKAAGCDPAVDKFDDWWAVHNAIAGGDDFVELIPLETLERVLASCKAQVIVIVTDDTIKVVSDAERAG